MPLILSLTSQCSCLFWTDWPWRWRCRELHSITSENWIFCFCGKFSFTYNSLYIWQQTM